MKVSDYIVEYLIEKGIKDVFGYPGGMVTHLMDSFSKYQNKIRAHVLYHEQAAAFAACGYAQESGNVGVAYATSGPGATNLITGICNAYFDSIPTLFITGQVNTFESKGDWGVRQRGFQETDVVSMVSGVTKYAAKVENVESVKWHLDYAFMMAMTGRKGPVLLDIPMNIFRSDVEPDKLNGYEVNETYNKKLSEKEVKLIEKKLKEAKRPVLLLGNGVKISGAIDVAQSMIEQISIPIVSTMLAVDVASESKLNYGFIGAYGSRVANFVVAKSDLIISLGARLDVRQVGAKRENFAPNATIIRVDIDPGELEYKVHANEISICACVKEVMEVICKVTFGNCDEYKEWISVCDEISNRLQDIDDLVPNTIIKRIKECLSKEAIITTDVGQNQVWIAQSLKVNKMQKIYFSGGHGAMGYSLPASIGCALATNKRVYSFNGDGGVQMNIQELQTVVREHLPIKVIVINNSALGMIRHFQEMYFDDNYYQTVPQGGYTVPNFGKIATAYGLEYHLIRSENDVNEEMFYGDAPALIEIQINEPTYVFPKLEFGKPNQDQEPLLERKLYNYLNAL